MRDIDVPSVLLGDTRDISCLRDMQMTQGHVARLSLACLATLGDTPNTVLSATCPLV